MPKYDVTAIWTGQAMTQIEIANTLRNAAELLRELAAWDEDALMIEAQADECDKAAIAIMRLEPQP